MDVRSIRLITQRLSQAEPSQLPDIIPSLTAPLSECHEIFARERNDGSEISRLVHKFKTQVTTMLHGREVQGRWAAVVLIKGSIEPLLYGAGGLETIKSLEQWMKGLLRLLKQTDSAATKRLAVITLTRIFLLTYGKKELQRQLITPHLSEFATLCLESLLSTSSKGTRVMDPQHPLLDTFLSSLIRLVPNHPSSLKPLAIRIRSDLGPLLAPTPSEIPPNEDIISLNHPAKKTSGLAQCLHALLPWCAPGKNGAAEEWSKYIRLILHQIDRTADRAFRAVAEGRTRSHDISSTRMVTDDSEEEELNDEVNDELKLPPWRGIYAGCERLLGLLHLLQAYIGAQGPMQYDLPLGLILSTVERILSVYGPQGTSSRNLRGEMQTNPTISKDERDWLFLMLPELHAAATDCLSLIISRIQYSSVSFAIDVLEQISWLSDREKGTCETRVSLYTVINQIVHSIGPSMTRSRASLLRPMLRLACQDLLPLPKDEGKHAIKTNGTSSKSTTIPAQQNPDSYLDPSLATQHTLAVPEMCRKAASQLLATCLRLVPSDKIHPSLRIEMDQIAVLTQDEEMLSASVLNPSVQSIKSNASLLPFVANANPGSPFVEALLRPRMPYIQPNTRLRNENEYSEEEDGEAGSPRAATSANKNMTDPSEVFDRSTPPPVFRIPVTLSTTDRPVLETSRISDAHPVIGPTVDSPKRARESNSPETAPQPDVAVEPPAKRIRMDESTISGHSAPSAAIQAQGGASSVIIGTNEELPAGVDAGDTSREHKGDETDSDDSFEIPPLVIDSSDDEDDDDDEEEEEEEEDEDNEV